MYEPARRNAVNSLILGVVLLFYGFLTSPVYREVDAGIYNTMVSLLFVVLRAGGVAFIVIAVLLYAGLRIALLLDAVVVGLCGVTLAVCSAYWIVTDGPGLQEVLYLAFAVLFMRAALGSFGAYKRGDAVGAPPAVAVVPPEEPVHPASVHPDALPTDGSAPSDGYLAALSKEKGEPPDASHR